MAIRNRQLAIPFGAALALLAWTPLEVHALINPRFTPVHLVRQSEAILELRMLPEVKQGRVAATLVRALKGKADQKAVEIDLAGTSYPDQARLVEKRIREGSHLHLGSS